MFIPTVAHSCTFVPSLVQKKPFTRMQRRVFCARGLHGRDSCTVCLQRAWRAASVRCPPSQAPTSSRGSAPPGDGGSHLGDSSPSHGSWVRLARAMLFKKGAVPGGQNLLGNKDRKKLRSRLQAQFPALSDEQLDEHLLPKCGDLSVQRIQGSKTQIYFVQDVPLFFEEGANVLFPSVYALMRLPGLVPCFVIHPQVSGFVLGGADLMLPGVLRPAPADYKTAFPPDGVILPQKPMAVKVLGNPVPFAVGRCLINNAELEKGKGRALELLHVFNDVLWSLGPKNKPEGYHNKIIDNLEESAAVAGGEPAAGATGSGATAAAAADNGMGESAGVSASAAAGEPADVSNASDSAAASGVPCVPDAALKDCDIAAAPAAATPAGAEDENARPAAETVAPARSVITAPPTLIDALLENCLLETLHSETPDSALPAAASAVWSKLMAHAPIIQLRPSFERVLSSSDLAISPDIVQAITSGRGLISTDVKFSSHKKMAKFFQFYSKQKKLLQVKDVRNELRIISINRTLDMYMKYSPLTEKERKQAKKCMTAAAGGAAAGSSENSSEAPSASVRLIDLYTPSNTMSSIFEIANVSPSVQNKYFTLQDAREALNAYIAKEGLISPDDPSLLLVNPTLAECLYTKDERQKYKTASTGAAASSAINDIKNIHSLTTTMKREEAMKRFAGALVSWVTTVRPGQSLADNPDDLEITAGKAGRIQVRSEKRARNFVTTVKNIQVYGIEAKTLAEQLQKAFAASATVFENLEHKGKHKPLAVQMQGSFCNEVADFLHAEYGVPMTYIDKDNYAIFSYAFFGCAFFGNASFGDASFGDASFGFGFFSYCVVSVGYVFFGYGFLRGILVQMIGRVRDHCARHAAPPSAGPFDDHPPRDVGKKGAGTATGAAAGGGGSGSAAAPCLAMVVDEKSLRILSSCCKVYDILEEGITVIENIQKKRQPLPQLEGIYFLSPDALSVEALCGDFAKLNQPQYSNVHLFFTAPLGAGEAGGALLQQIAACPGLTARLKSLVEFNLSFIAYEKRVFHLGMPDLLCNLLLQRRLELLDEVATELLTVCATLGDRPTVRYLQNNLKLCEQLASRLQRKLDQLQVSGLSRGSSVLIIADRSVDLPTVLVHEYTYQAAIYDLLNVGVCSPAVVGRFAAAAGGALDDGPPTDDSIQYPYVAAAPAAAGGAEGKAEKRTALLNESDEVFVKYRHHHLMSALKKVPQDITKFLRENAAAKIGKKNDLSNEELQRAIRDLPEYQEMLAKYTLHHSISQRCIREMNRLGLPRAGPLEQDLATGVDNAGKELSAKKNLAALGGLLADPAIGMEEKLRLLLLYFSVTDGVKEDDKRKMMAAAQLPLDFQRCVQTFTNLGLENAFTDPTAVPPPSHVPKLTRDKERISYFANRAKTVEVALSRFQPYLRDVMEKAIQGELPLHRFPLVSAPDEARASLQWETQNDRGRRGAAHVRARDQDWDFSNADGEVGGGAPAAPTGGAVLPFLSGYRRERPAIIVFVIGGVTLAETRAAYEVSKQTGVDVLIGGSAVITPKTFLQMLKRHSDGAAALPQQVGFTWQTPPM